jgi:hypothetical protein
MEIILIFLFLSLIIGMFVNRVTMGIRLLMVGLVAGMLLLLYFT